MRPSRILLSVSASLLTLSIGSSALSQESSAPESAITHTIGQQAEYRFVDVDGEFQLFWGEHVVLRELSLSLEGKSLDFAPDLIQLEQNSRQITLRPSKEDKTGTFKLLGTFSLSFSPTIRRHSNPENGILQFAQGRNASKRCDLLVAPKLGLGLALRRADLDLSFWKEGGPAEVKIALHDHPTLELVDLPTPQAADASLASLQSELIRRFGDKNGKLPATLAQLFSPIRKNLASIECLDLAPPTWAEIQIVNFRIGTGDQHPAFDVLLFLNSSDSPRKMVADFRTLGWEKAKARRFAVDFPSGECQAEIRNSISIDVPANGWSLKLMRAHMPRGIVATSDGPLSALKRPWIWDGSGTATSGSKSLLVTFKGQRNSIPGGWMIYSSANARKAPFKVQSAKTSNGPDLNFVQEGCWARIDYPISDQDWQILELTVGVSETP